MLARARSAFLDFLTTPPMRAQKEAFLPFAAFVLGFGAGAFRFDPVARLCLALPLAVSPAPLLVGSFSPLPTDSSTLARLFDMCSILSFDVSQAFNF